MTDLETRLHQALTSTVDRAMPGSRPGADTVIAGARRRMRRRQRVRSASAAAIVVTCTAAAVTVALRSGDDILRPVDPAATPADSRLFPADLGGAEMVDGGFGEGRTVSTQIWEVDGEPLLAVSVDDTVAIAGGVIDDVRVAGWEQAGAIVDHGTGLSLHLVDDGVAAQVWAPDATRGELLAWARHLQLRQGRQGVDIDPALLPQEAVLTVDDHVAATPDVNFDFMGDQPALIGFRVSSASPSMVRFQEFVGPPTRTVPIGETTGALRLDTGGATLTWQPSPSLLAQVTVAGSAEDATALARRVAASVAPVDVDDWADLLTTSTPGVDATGAAAGADDVAAQFRSLRNEALAAGAIDQAQALADGAITDAEIADAARQFDTCLATVGWDLVDPMPDPIRGGPALTYAMSSVAESAETHDLDRCSIAHFRYVEIAAQSTRSNRIDPELLAVSRRCLSDRTGRAVDDTLVSVDQLISAYGEQITGACVTEAFSEVFPEVDPQAFPGW
jgi:hypothetical protein